MSRGFAILRRAALIAATLGALIPAGQAARANEAAIARVTGLMQRLDAAMGLDDTARIAELQRVYRAAFDRDALALAILPETLRRNATADIRRDFSATLICRMAVETSRRGGLESRGDWSLVGARDGAPGAIVALRFVRDNGGQRTLIFELAQGADGWLIRDIRTEIGRMTSRMAEDLLREVGPPGDGAPADEWLDRVICAL